MSGIDDHGAADAVVRPRRRRIGFDLTALALIGVLLAGAIGTTGILMYRHLYSPTAFVLNYLDLLGRGQAADALTLPGVAIDSSELSGTGAADAERFTSASDALLRQAALAPLSNASGVSEVADDDGSVLVTVDYTAGAYEGTSTFRVRQSGWLGVAPAWRFAESPLAVIDLTVRGSMQFQVNGFEIDKRQVSPLQGEADPLAPVSLLVFSPGLYSIRVDTAITTSPGVAVLSDQPAAGIPVELQTQPTDEFVAVVQDRVNTFLAECATQQVLQPTGCPFGFPVRNRIVEPPTWSIVQQPLVALAPSGANWTIERTEATAHIQVDIQSLFDGSVRQVDEDVPFFLTGEVAILPDGTASITVAATD